MGILQGLLGKEMEKWKNQLLPQTQLSRRSWASVEYTPKGSDKAEDITDDLILYLLSIDYTDNIADAVDDLTITLEDKSNLWQAEWFPEAGAKLSVTLHTLNNMNLSEGVLDRPLGIFEVDQIEVDALPSTVQIKAVACTLDSKLRGDKVSKEWKSTTLKTIAKDIAEKNQLKLNWTSKDDPDPEYNQVDQTDESDLEFLRKLCKDAGMNLKVTDDSLIIYNERQLEQENPKIRFVRPKLPNPNPFPMIQMNVVNSPAASVNSAGQLEIDRFLSYKMTAKTRDIYKACHLKYKKGKDKEVIEATFTDPNKETGKTLEVNDQCETQTEAERIVKNKLRDKNKDEVTCSFSIPGDLIYYAGQTIELSKFGHFDGKYIITKLSYRMGTGYTLDMDLRRCLDGY